MWNIVSLERPQRQRRGLSITHTIRWAAGPRRRGRQGQSVNLGIFALEVQLAIRLGWQPFYPQALQTPLLRLS